MLLVPQHSGQCLSHYQSLVLGRTFRSNGLAEGICLPSQGLQGRVEVLEWMGLELLTEGLSVQVLPDKPLQGLTATR
jgi:hypothetical protein